MARLPDSFLDELRARTPLAALVGRRVKLSRSGRNWKGCCPFHAEKSPSFYVYDDGYHCFGCGAHGDAIRFVMDSGGGGFMEVVEQLAAQAGLEVPKPTPAAAEADRQRLDGHAILEHAASLYQQNLLAPQGAAALAYLRGRGLTDETIRRFGLGYSGEGRGWLIQRLAAVATPARLLETGLLRAAEDGAPGRELFYNRVMFPIRDRRGRVISFGGRILGDGQPKYVNGPETALFSKRRTLYGLDAAREAVRGGAPVVAVEGYMDVIALHQAGFAGAVAPLGTALTDEQLEVLWQLSPAPVLCFDGDAAGGRAAARAAEIALPRLTLDRTIRIATLPTGEDPDTLVRKHGATAFAGVLQAARALSECLFGLLREAGRFDDLTDRARFRARLDAAAARIGDRHLASEYRDALRCQYETQVRVSPWKGNAGKKKRGASNLGMRPSSSGPSGGIAGYAGTQSRPLPQEASADAERMRHLTAIVLRHPSLLPKLEETLASLPLPPAAGRLLAAMQSCADQADSLDFTTLLNHLTLLRLADDAAWALGDVPLPLPACAGPAASVNEAEAAWRGIYGLMRRSLLEAELAQARRDCAASFTAGSVQRVEALAASLFGRAGADDPAEFSRED